MADIKVGREQDYANEIGFFFKYKLSWSREQFAQLGITDVTYEDDIGLTIRLCRPGFLIGSKGKTIDALREYLTKTFNKDVKIAIKENRICDYLFASYNRYDDYFRDLMLFKKE
jgi:ribosomal protein S3